MMLTGKQEHISSLATITYIDEGEFLRMNMISSVVVEDKNKMAKNQELA